MSELSLGIEKVLVIAAHPDDEILGCGGTVAKWINKGVKVHSLILAEGLASRETREKDRQFVQRLEEFHQLARRANNILGVESIQIHSFPDNRMDSLALLDVIRIVEEKIKTFGPDTILTHFNGDLNVDHRITQQAVATSCRGLPNHVVKNVLMFETPSSTEWQMSGSKIFRPQVYSNISDTIEIKLDALRMYGREMRDWPHARSLESIEHLARWRGSNIGCNAAEAFEVGRIIF